MARKGDDVCWNCTGVTFYNEELRKLGKRPKCYGIEYKATVPIPPDKMALLDEVPRLPSNTKVFLIGHSQASAKMHQQGQTPVLRYGIEISMVQETSKASEASSNNTDKKQPSRDMTSVNSFPFYPPPKSATDQQSASKPKNDTDKMQIAPHSRNSHDDNLFDLSHRAWTNYKRSSLKLLSSMDKVWKQTTTNLPDRFSRSFMKLGRSCQRTLEIMVHRMQVVAGLGDDGKRKPPHK